MANNINREGFKKGSSSSALLRSKTISFLIPVSCPSITTVLRAYRSPSNEQHFLLAKICELSRMGIVR